MKNHLLTFSKTLLLFMALTSVVACKKDDDSEKNNSDKVIKLTIEHSGDVRYYKGYLSVNGTINKNQKRVTVSGVTWDDQTSEGEITLYEKSFDPITPTTTIQTDGPASGINIGYSAFYIPTDQIQHTPVTATFKYYVDGELVKTDTYKAGSTVNVDPYLGSIDASKF